jgi:hypothetical protein
MRRFWPTRGCCAMEEKIISEKYAICSIKLYTRHSFYVNSYRHSNGVELCVCVQINEAGICTSEDYEHR